ncbi:MAG: hypothetical protein OEO21_13280, partial [Candidatus Krumholzibacteria bacterium]|nr:hypothetical protein [Candidatus Krumholzibacteria bacterium]
MPRPICRQHFIALVASIAAIMLSCGAREPSPLPPDCFAFGVFGDGPYRAWEMGRFLHVIDEVNHADLEWFLHVGDIFWYPCSDQHYMSELATMNAIQHPVVYTPGDNEWADCHDDMAGRYEPLERLARLRSLFFADPRRSLGTRTMPLEAQSENPAFAEFVENARWVRGGFVFATLHMVGSHNAGEPFPGRGAADDAEVVRRTDAALAWMDETFALAHAEGLSGVVLAIHGSPIPERVPHAREGYGAFIDRLEDLTKAFAGEVLLIHGDSHQQRVDHPLRDHATGETLANFTRLETY